LERKKNERRRNSSLVAATAVAEQMRDVEM